MSLRLVVEFFLALAWERRHPFVVGFIVGAGAHACAFGGW
jgi:hypothetical protein